MFNKIFFLLSFFLSFYTYAQETQPASQDSENLISMGELIQNRASGDLLGLACTHYLAETEECKAVRFFGIDHNKKFSWVSSELATPTPNTLHQGLLNLSKRARKQIREERRERTASLRKVGAILLGFSGFIAGGLTSAHTQTMAPGLITFGLLTGPIMINSITQRCSDTAFWERVIDLGGGLVSVMGKPSYQTVSLTDRDNWNWSSHIGKRMSDRKFKTLASIIGSLGHL